MDAYYQEHSGCTYAAMVEQAVIENTGRSPPILGTCDRGEVHYGPKLGTRECNLGFMFNNYHNAVFNARNPQRKRLPGLTHGITVALRDNMCRAEFICYAPDHKPIGEPIAAEWALRDGNGTPDATAAGAAMETLIEKSLALCV